MSFLYSHSCECLKTELDLFSLPPTQTLIESSQWIHYKPISSLADDSLIEFVIPGHVEEYIDLAHTMLSIRVKLITPTITFQNRETIAKISVVNNLLHSLFNQIDVYFNQKLVSPPNNAYAYRAYLETLFNYGPAAKRSHLSTALWYTDDHKNMEDVNRDSTGFGARRALLQPDGVVDMIGHLHCDVFNQNKFLLNGVEMRLRLVRSKNTFTLLDRTKQCSLHISKATLLVRRSKISPAVLLAYTKALSHGTAKYSITRVEVKTFILHRGVHAETLDVILGQLPKRIPSKPLQPDINKEGLYIDCYQTLFSGTGRHFLNDGNDIDRASYPNGFCLFAFATRSVETVNCVVYGEYDNVLEIDSTRQVIVDFGVFPADHIPTVLMLPCAIVVNTDGHTKPGTHWIAIHIDRHGTGTYFDSYGLPPFVPQHLTCLRRNCTYYRWNPTQLQSVSSEVCVHFGR
ncbi:uncharacterized protein F54H12.2-like [Leptopilina boulardi]|uniref:uncharacterized protein F54H12.2-like n=1 Tax=Leptopilina boulardi TaxID=63433 RepID=UPI0021F5D3AB|nr:uncharacterized protein F54H12.2-like [Leptopilina boulardi]